MANELLKAQIEAALFLSEKPMKAAAVARIVNAEIDVVRQLILELINDYETRNGGLEVSDDDGYIIQVKDEYTHLVDEFVPIDMPTALIRTLSAIAIKQPVMQSEVIKIRGAGAYDHIKELIERELISKREEGRSPILTTTKKFQEYFRLSKDGKNFRSELSGEARVAKDQPAEGAVLENSGEIVASGETVDSKSGNLIFDASPDPDTPPIGEPGPAVSEQDESSEQKGLDQISARGSNEESGLDNDSKESTETVVEKIEVAEQVEVVTASEDKPDADAFVDSNSVSESTTLQ